MAAGVIKREEVSSTSGAAAPDVTTSAMPAALSRIPIAVLAEGADWLAVSKPPHLLVHPTRPGGPVTLLDQLRELLAFECAAGGQVSLIHRLDRETSGVILVAKTVSAARRLSFAMMHGKIRKEYLAVVRGWPEWDEALFDGPLLRQGEKQPSAIWLKQMVHADGAAARTRCVVRQRGRFGAEPISWIQAIPETGRLHQIRVHLAHAGYPLVGDKIYGLDESCYLRFIEAGWTPELAQVLWLNRHALHAQRLTFPDGAGTVTAEAPIPPDLTPLLTES